jgi:hypothetical protein
MAGEATVASFEVDGLDMVLARYLGSVGNGPGEAVSGKGARDDCPVVGSSPGADRACAEDMAVEGIRAANGAEAVDNGDSRDKVADIDGVEGLVSFLLVSKLKCLASV